eukprot:4672955-Amphidinium_carterae.1
MQGSLLNIVQRHASRKRIVHEHLHRKVFEEHTASSSRRWVHLPLFDWSTNGGQNMTTFAIAINEGSSGDAVAKIHLVAA